MFDKKNFILGFFSILTLLVLSRVIPHPPNFTPVIAVAIFSPYLFKDRIVSLSVPLGAMLLSDILIGMHSSMIWVYFSVLVVYLLTSVFKKVSLGMKRFASLAMVSSGLFFAITNFGVWLSGGLYPKSLEGLIICYYAFYKHSPKHIFLWLCHIWVLKTNGLLEPFESSRVKFCEKKNSIYLWLGLCWPPSCSPTKLNWMGHRRN
jgi:hypothetical protein